jgi:hypothetical protein
MDLTLEQERLVELPQRFETGGSFFGFSPVTVAVGQTALALNAVNVGGAQTAIAANISVVHVG